MAKNNQHQNKYTRLTQAAIQRSGIIIIVITTHEMSSRLLNMLADAVVTAP
jgi:hypothetical protein